jgi:hypothetical protein
MIAIIAKKPTEYPIPAPCHENHESSVSGSFTGGCSVGIPHNPLLLAYEFESFIVSIWPPTGI